MAELLFKCLGLTLKDAIGSRDLKKSRASFYQRCFMIGILNTGVSNSKSVFYALERIGVPYKMVDSADEMNSCDRFIIPGVGHFNQLNSNFSIELREA